MNENDCIHLLDPATCTICNGRDERERRNRIRTVERPRIFPARFAGDCDACNLPIHVGQPIVWRPDTCPIHETCL